MHKRDFLSIVDFSSDELTELLNRARRLKVGEDHSRLTGKSLAMIFRKSSTRTRISFEVGMTQLGGHALFISDHDSQIGRGEPIHDTAKVLSRYVDGIMIRTFGHEEVEELSRHSSVPVINGLSDLLHPCQVVADLQTVAEEFGPNYPERTVAWIGDGNNMANSWLNAAYRLGFSVRLACPEGYDPDPSIFKRAEETADILLTRDPFEAVQGADVVTTDVWASMGQEEEARERMGAFAGFSVDDALMGQAIPDAIFLHCLPAHRGEEVSSSVIDGTQSRIFNEAENRLHAQKAILLELFG
ncbi:MAG: ornithine carbamoyltransferase [Gemmatimonadota bacterium]|jgi:ornithine carbamoyltransferase|nr:ornithine carbamoyltransferase [Gemmatimonadota bacterium]MEC9317243.1 ornithine carbamoyltransferase [Gemmatimonadota bacterium]HCK35335.1 ornithine carbamoyltransferase [Gemmatimonadota bacterium]|tara:strand:+ start:1636 stop:2535 length:900 start_codon:yes stop_codon:yes gene_type:complete